MLHIGQADLKACLDTVHAVGEDSASVAGFMQAGVAHLPRLIASDLTHVSVCDLGSGKRDVVSDRPGDYREVRIDYVLALFVHVEGRELVSFVFNRLDRDFSDRDRACAEAIRPHLGDLYRMVRALDGASAAWGVPPTSSPAPGCPLTEREREVLQWLGSGKTDKDIGGILAISPRTVHKHLQSIYAKLGVETRTAAVMRAMKLGPRSTGTAQFSVYRPEVVNIR